MNTGTIVLVDDETDFLDSLKRVLCVAGFPHVVCFSDPVAARLYFSEGGKADVAVIDIIMPGLSGEDLLSSIRTERSEVECVVMSALNDVQLAVSCLKKGAFHYLVKPTSRDDIHTKGRYDLPQKRWGDLDKQEAHHLFAHLCRLKHHGGDPFVPDRRWVVVFLLP